MKITKTLIITGREGDLEHYALLIENQIIACNYDSSKGDHNEFVKKVAKDFAMAYSLLAKKMGINNIGIWNGYKVLNDGITEKIGRLEDIGMLASEFSKDIKSLAGENEEVIAPPNIN